MFEQITLKDAEAAIDEIKQTLAKVDAARATNDWLTLRQLGYANRVDGAREGQYRMEFRQTRYDDDKHIAEMTPEQYMRWLNDSLDH